MKDEIDPDTGFAARVDVANVTLGESEDSSAARARRDRLIDVVLITRRKVVKTNDRLPQAQQFLDKIGSYEACSPRDQPRQRPSQEFVTNNLIASSTGIACHSA